MDGTSWWTARLGAEVAIVPVVVRPIRFLRQVHQYPVPHRI